MPVIALAFTSADLISARLSRTEYCRRPTLLDVWVRREVSAAVEVELTTNPSDFRSHDASRQGRSYVGLARAEGGKKSSIACPSQQGVANHLSMAFCRERSTAHSCRRRHGLQSNRIEAPTRVVRVQASWRRNKLNYLRARAEERAFLRPYASGLPFSYRSGCGHERLTGCGRCPSPT